ncbi:MAG TPA: amidohydrolase family protein [Acidimicrobiia bacterium]|nr:amidohydrolase family protein [Acidimicrobiia bacterium]
MHDLVIRNGILADGTGAPLRPADVAVAGGRVVEVGEVTGRGRQEVDAGGALVAPGWVDIHTHYDGQATWDPHLFPSSSNGVTTVVFGNCGVGFAPVRAEDRDRLICLMEGVEDIPGTALHEGLPWTWTTFPEYLDALERTPHDIDCAAYAPHGAMRVHAMGERAVAGEVATADDIARMAAVAREAVAAGAVGFSTSRTLNHRSSTGEKTPSLTASADELAGIAAGVAAAGRGVLQVISDFLDVDEEWAVLRRMAEGSGRPLSISVAQLPDRPGLHHAILERIASANADGVRVTAQVAPRSIGILMGLPLTLHPFMTNPVFAEIAGRPLADQVAALRRPEFRTRLLAAHTGERDRTKLGGFLIDRFDRMYPFGDPPDYEPDPGLALGRRSAATGTPATELALDALLADDGQGMLYLPFANYVDGNLDEARGMMLHPNAVPGLSDGGAHVGTICDGGFPTFLLSHWGVRRAEGRLPVEWLVERQTRATARTVGLTDRGVVAPGWKADLNVIDLDRLALHRPRLHHDLPAGGRRLLQQADGYRHTFVSGTEIQRDGEPTGNLPGRLVRSGAATGS